MHGTVIAASRNLGIVVIQTDTQGCAVLEVKGLWADPLDIGERIEGQRDEQGVITLRHPVSGQALVALVQREGISRGEAVSSMSII